MKKQAVQDKLRNLLDQVSFNINKKLARIDFLHQIMKLFTTSLQCDEVELWLFDSSTMKSFEKIKQTGDVFSYTIDALQCEERNSLVRPLTSNDYMEQFGFFLINDLFVKNEQFLTEKGAFFFQNTGKPFIITFKDQKNPQEYQFNYPGDFRSLLMIPLLDNTKKMGLLQVKSNKDNFFPLYIVKIYEQFAHNFALSLLNQKMQAALSERIKELTCMYGIAQAAVSRSSISEIMQDAVELLPPAWQYPEITCARIIFDTHLYTTKNFEESPWRQTAGIFINGIKRGLIEVIYTREKIYMEDGPFLNEERILLDNVAKSLAAIIEKKEAENDKDRLQQQILHADRLATIGQLAAGVAHEINEPLANILGFAQLSKKEKQVPQRVLDDLGRIERATLHAREIVKKLMFFAKQMPAKKMTVDFNQIITDGLSFIESRCLKSNIDLEVNMEKELPGIYADPSQLMQVLINLLVNAIQAMPAGGKLQVKTGLVDDMIMLMVKDSGCGIDESIIDKIFLPFFTTKDVHEGTGLGLSVVHGIVVAHNGKIHVKNNEDTGTCFNLQFPINSHVS